jgi:hypothetical protein
MTYARWRHLANPNNKIADFDDYQNISDLMWLAVDLDGTLAEGIWTPENPTSEIGRPIYRNVLKLQKCVDAGYKIVIHTARPNTDYKNIEGWLRYWGIPFREIQTGKILARLYIDDRGRFSEDESWLPKEK